MGEQIFVDEIEWTITGHGPVARTFHGMKDLIDNAEQALFDRWATPAAVTTKGVWANDEGVRSHHLQPAHLTVWLDPDAYETCARMDVYR